MNQNQDTGPNAVGHKSIVTAVTTAIYDRFSNKGVLPPLDPSLRVDGQTCLITGASSGLGKAVAIQMAQRGARLILACRAGHENLVQEIRHASGNDSIELLTVDLSDLNSANRLCDQLRDRGTRLDIAILNAGLMPLNARRSQQGFELMFAVHFLANRLLLQRWLTDGVIRGNPQRPPRVVFVASEAHQSSDPIDFNRFGAFVDFGMKDGMKHYSMSKLHLCTFASELSRRVNADQQVNVAIHALCPGPIASNIARESPAFIKPILWPIMKLLFRSPEKAAEPVLYLACANDMGRRTGVYLHMMREKAMANGARDTRNGQQLWEKSAALLQPYTNGARTVETA
ncbi:MAG TPA: SDR family NAD(P)-dependent oxidoreductase [Dongiaceae bacterium]|nr:SDR family NAD(P)-dependent oxidoreductase [Dongiaceae bacterium]